MFKILTLLRDINAVRRADWYIESAAATKDSHHMVVRISLTDDDLAFVQDMQIMFAHEDVV